MMGERQVDQDALFYVFSLERHVPADHLLRSMDRFVNLDEARAHLAPFYSNTGRPSIDPELLIRMLLVGYCYGIRIFPDKQGIRFSAGARVRTSSIRAKLPTSTSHPNWR